MIYLSDHLIEIEHLGLGRYNGEKFRTMINPERIQTIRTKGPDVHLEGPTEGLKTFQIIYSYKGYTESFVVEDHEYIKVIIFLALGKEGFNYYMTHGDRNIERFTDKALQTIYGREDDSPNAGILVSYIRDQLEIEKRKITKFSEGD